ncbi:hypothetical protein [Streptomyces scabiei]|uniref:hypothetical protein n=1 Tax=Streptomyces scabiei TaxID=1930 RepID=UPI0029A47168|nr:hypothetical protein [Streptomyces scabiei]MDX3283520.1 hypothetical protein [Streptomyces scabiei]MDX3283522.1 hypothetical protein [Streptomyces scabiei]
MKHTAKQTRTKTLADLYRAADRHHAVTITYRDRDGEITVRTVEIHELRTTRVEITKAGEVKGGDIIVVAMCRLRAAELAARADAGEDVQGKTAEREFSLSGILTYTLHRIGFVLTRPEPTVYERPAPAPADNADALYFYELARDKDDADYRPRVRLSRSQTDLAA